MSAIKLLPKLMSFPERIKAIPQHDYETIKKALDEAEAIIKTLTEDRATFAQNALAAVLFEQAIASAILCRDALKIGVEKSLN